MPNLSANQEILKPSSACGLLPFTNLKGTYRPIGIHLIFRLFPSLRSKLKVKNQKYKPPPVDKRSLSACFCAVLRKCDFYSSAARSRCLLNFYTPRLKKKCKNCSASKNA